MPGRSKRAIACLLCAAATAPIAAQDAPAPARTRTRIGLGPQIVPSYPGADRVNVRPLVDVSRARGDAPFEFEAADESFGFPVWRSKGLAVGPSLGFEGRRRAEDTAGLLPTVGRAFEVGGFVQYQLTAPVRFRAEVRKGLGGHKGWVANVGADYVMRNGDDWLVAIGPRVTLSDARYQRAYFGVTPAEAATSGLAAFRPDAGVQAVGINLGYVRQITRRWGVYSYAKYDRLVDDAGQSPVVRAFGSRNQLSGGAALTYTFGG